MDELNQRGVKFALINVIKAQGKNQSSFTSMVKEFNVHL